MRILFLSAWFPYPPDNGSRLRIFNLIRGLAHHHEITLVTFAEKVPKEPVQVLEEICKSIHVLPKTEYNKNSARALSGFLCRKPRVLADRYMLEMDRRIQDEITIGNHDLIIASQIYMADYLDMACDIPAVFDEVEVGVFVDAVRKAGNVISKTRRRLTLFKLQTYFQHLLFNFDSCTVVSYTERQLLREMVPEFGSVEIIPNGVDLASYRDIDEIPQPNRLIFTGSLTFIPNYDAMHWFVKKVYPLIQIEVLDVHLTITGDKTGQKLPDARNVHLVGHVDDVRPLIASSWISLAPIFSGGGTRLKILEAFALRTPVIATTKGAEGLEVQHNEHLLLADTPEAFAEQTVRLLNDKNLRQKLVSNGYKLVFDMYDWSVIMPKYLRLIDHTVK